MEILRSRATPRCLGFGPIGAGYRIRTKEGVEMALLATEGDRVCSLDTMSFPSPSHYRWKRKRGRRGAWMETGRK